MDFVCASPFASQWERSVPYVDRSRAAAGASALYGEGLRDMVFFRGIYGVLGAFLLVSPMGNTTSLL